MLIGIVDSVIQFYGALILVYVLLSWFRPSGFVFEIFRVIGSVVEPYIGLFRRFMPPTGVVDFSPLVAILVLNYLIRPLLFALVARV